MTGMHSTSRSAFRLVLVMLLALSSAMQQRAEVHQVRTEDCTSDEACAEQPEGFTLSEATDALAASAARLRVDSVRSAHRNAGNPRVRAGVDVLFFARNELLVAQARAWLDEHFDLTLTIHAATHGIASSPSRAPPALS
jgi:hypothetical protein